MSAPITLDMHIPNGADGWTLAEAVEAIKREQLTGLLQDTVEELSELELTFLWSVRDGKPPTCGQILAAYWTAVTEQLEQAYYDDEAITHGQYRYRRQAARRIVFRKAV